MRSLGVDLGLAALVLLAAARLDQRHGAGVALVLGQRAQHDAARARGGATGGAGLLLRGAARPEPDGVGAGRSGAGRAAGAAGAGAAAAGGRRGARAARRRGAGACASGLPSPGPMTRRFTFSTTTALRAPVREALAYDALLHRTLQAQASWTGR